MKPVIKDTIIVTLAATTIIGFIYYTNTLNSYNDLVDKYSKLANEYHNLLNNVNCGIF